MPSSYWKKMKKNQTWIYWHKSNLIRVQRDRCFRWVIIRIFVVLNRFMFRFLEKYEQPLRHWDRLRPTLRQHRNLSQAPIILHTLNFTKWANLHGTQRYNRLWYFIGCVFELKINIYYLLSGIELGTSAALIACASEAASTGITSNWNKISIQLTSLNTHISIRQLCFHQAVIIRGQYCVFGWIFSGKYILKQALFTWKCNRYYKIPIMVLATSHRNRSIQYRVVSDFSVTGAKNGFDIGGKSKFSLESNWRQELHRVRV